MSDRPFVEGEPSNAYDRIRAQAVAEIAEEKRRKREEAWKETKLGCLAIVLLLTLGAPVLGFTLSTLWRWFMVPLGVPAIGMAHAYGLLLLVMMFRPKKHTKSTATEGLKDFGYVLFLSAYALAVGYIVTLFM